MVKHARTHLPKYILDSFGLNLKNKYPRFRLAEWHSK